jgi:hypothetical protein
MWGRDEAEVQARLEEHNQPIHRIRGRIEKIFGTWKRSYGLRRMRWRGLSKAGLQIRLTAVAYNMKRCLNITAAAPWKGANKRQIDEDRKRSQHRLPSTDLEGWYPRKMQSIQRKDMSAHRSHKPPPKTLRR